MARILTILSLLLALILFPPATLALVSNSAVPGDATYMVKRKLEDVVLLIASLTPQSKAWFAVERSSRRFKEAAVLLNKGEQASTTLAELVDQTSTAAQEVTQINDPIKKQQLIEQLSQSITTYNEGLAIAANLPVATPTLEEPLSTPTTTPTPAPATAEPTPVAMPIPKLSTPPTSGPKKPLPPLPSVTPTPTPQPTSAPQPAPQPITSTNDKKEQVDQTKKELEKIKKRLEEEREKLKEQRERSEKREKKGDN